MGVYGGYWARASKASLLHTPCQGAGGHSGVSGAPRVDPGGTGRRRRAGRAGLGRAGFCARGRRHGGVRRGTVRPAWKESAEERRSYCLVKNGLAVLAGGACECRHRCRAGLRGRAATAWTKEVGAGRVGGRGRGREVPRLHCATSCEQPVSPGGSPTVETDRASTWAGSISERAERRARWRRAGPAQELDGTGLVGESRRERSARSVVQQRRGLRSRGFGLPDLGYDPEASGGLARASGMLGRWGGATWATRMTRTALLGGDEGRSQALRTSDIDRTTSIMG